MPYAYMGSNVAYRGDYYRGDYYRGDPGLLGNIFGGIVGAAKGLVTGGPLGAITGGIGGLIGKKPSTAMIPFSPPPGITPPILQQPFQPGVGVQTGTLRIGAFAPTMGPGGMQIGPSGTPLVPTMRGLHYNKSTYETRGGGTSRWGPAGSLQIHPKGSVLVKSRRMNVGNARALKHALRRAYGFERLARRVLRLTHPRRTPRFAGFKSRKRAKR